MKAVICAACQKLLGYSGSNGTQKELEQLAVLHRPICSATPEEYEQALVDLKFRQITKGLDL